MDAFILYISIYMKRGCEITQTQITKEVHRLFRVSGPPFVVKFT